MSKKKTNIIEEVTSGDYKYGFTTDIETEVIPHGLYENVIRLISSKKNEPDWLLEFRLKAYRYWLTMKMPNWAHLTIPEIDYQQIAYYAAPRKHAPQSLDEVDPELINTFNKLGIPIEEQKEIGLSDGLIRFSIGLDNDIERTYQMMKKCMQELNIF